MMRSILAVATSIVLWGLLWVSTNTALAAALPTRFDVVGATRDPAMLVLFLGVCAGLCTLAGWLCAIIARGSRMKHVRVLAFIQLGIGIFVQVGVWELMPAWYHILFLSLVVPMHLVGGRIGVRRIGERSEALARAAATA